MSYKHGIYITEESTDIIAPVYSDAAVQVVVGTAPINLLSAPESAVNTPILCNDFKECVAQLGYSDDFEKYNLCQSMDVTFRVFNVAPIIFINVLDPTVHKKAVAEASYQVNNKAVLINATDILLNSIVVKNTAGDKTYVKDTDYIASFDDNGKVVITLDSDGDAYAETNLKIAYNAIDPSMVTESDIIGGYNAATGKYKGLECISQIFPIHSIVPGIITAPGYSQNPNVYAMLVAKSNNINDCFKAVNIADIPSVESGCLTYTACNAWKNEHSYIDKSSYVCWPEVKIGTKQYYMSAVWSALWASTIANHNGVPFVAPSNKDFKITGTCLHDGTPVFLDKLQANTLNGQGIATALNWQGWKSWGVEMACYPANTDVKDRFSSCRAMFNWWGNTFILTYFSKIDSSTNRRLIDAVVDSENARANGFTTNQEILYAKITFNESDNPVTSLLDGKIKFRQKLTTPPPAKEIENVLEYDVEALKTLFGKE